MKRRKFLGLVCALSPSLVLPGRAVSFPGLEIEAAHPGVSDIRNLLASLFVQTEHAKIVGLRYLADYPERSVLEELLSSLGIASRGSPALDTARLRSHINDLQRLDFAACNTVTVGAWILSRTEADLCALVALT